MPSSLSIVGAGRVGRALGSILRASGWKIDLVVTQRAPSARRAVRFIGAGIACAGIRRRILESRVILIATPDHAVERVAVELARIGGEELRGRIILHTSGALDTSVLQAVQTHGASV